VVLEDLGPDLALMARLVQSQLGTAMTGFFRRDTRLAAKVTDKDDHVDNLLGFIEEKCFERLAGEAADSPRSRRLRGIVRVATNLEKLGDYAVSIAEQTVHASRLPARPLPFDLAGSTRVALAALDEVITAFADGDAEKATHACRCEAELDHRYRDALQEAFLRLGQPGQDAAFVVTCLLVANYLERIGDAILNIGETALFILTGQRLKLHQYLHLGEMVATVAPAPAPSVDFRRIWGGISGARVGRLAVDGRAPLIWKEGAPNKIEEEVRQMQEWNRIVPGLVPHLEARLARDGREAFLGEYLDGVLLRDVYLAHPWEDKVRATRRLLETVRDIWLATTEKEAPRAGYVRQIRERLPELYDIHPELETLRGQTTRVFGIAHCSLDVLLDRLESIEPTLAPPVTVRIHGDFNTNNVLYDAGHDRVHFIDVHRSSSGDYLQDIGVFLVSSLRTPIQDARVTADLERLNGQVVAFAAEFGRLVGDDHFERRLALSQARSFMTSGRLLTDVEFAKSLYLQGVHLLEQVAGAPA
jgi:phosphate uptake regulator